MKKAIIFDFGQTLANSADGFRLAEKEAELEIFAFLGAYSWDKFISQYRASRKAFHEKSDFSRKALWREVCLQCGVEPDDGFLERCEGKYWDTVESNTALFPETLVTLRKLADKYRLALISNTQGQRGAGRHRLGLFPELEGLFEEIIIAGESGIPPKPDPAPFRLCLDAMRMGPAEAVFVGDDLRIDIYGAKSAGIDPVWIKHYLVQRSWPDVRVFVPVISSLDQLLLMDRILLGS